ncbi:MAG: lamin tail domain-containing protein, partial [Paludibacteraceae bacterium]|nr:lamin tail domain-containing protein [Paludibacteraceae bacterium]
MYDSPLNEKVTEPPYSNGEFIELYNGGTDSVNLKNWLIKGDGTTEVYIFDSLILAPCAFLLLAYRHNNSQDFQINDLYHNLPPTANYQIVYQNKIVLSNSGEHLILKNSLNQTVDSIYYDGTSHKTSPYRIYAENEDSINAIYCRSLHRTNIEFDQQGLALPHYSQWQTTNITFAQLALAENYFYENKFLGTDASLPMNENYIVSITPLDATARISNNNNQPSASSTIRTITDIQYYDGIGRPDQNILLNITPDKHDLVSLQEYSGISRNTINYLPLPTTSNGQPAHYETISNQLQDYYSDQRPFTETFYENSHLKRIIGQTKAGETYQNHPTNNSYEFNTSADNVRKFDIICTSQNKYLKCQNNYYPENTLYKNTITDEDGVAVTTFSDKLGRKILERRNGNDTYFVYDDKGFLYCVLPNLDNSQAFSELTDIKNDDYLKHNAYIYDYTPNGNLIYKHLPSIEPQLMVYDKTRHLIMIQTANQRQKNKWTFYSQDSLGRNILSAEIHTLLSHQQLIEKNDTIWQVGRNINYTNPQILCQKYYDNYDFLNNLNTQTKNKLKYEQLQNYDIQHDNASGLLTGTKIYSLEENKFVYTTLYYDYKGKVIQQRQTTFDNSYRVIYFSYNFDGTVSKQLICKFSENDNCIVEHYAYCYDHAGKLTHTYYKLNEEPEILHSHKLYNELGLLTKNIRHNNTDTIEYRYDMRGLLTHTLSNASSEQLFYADSLDIGITPCYNGNISASYKTHADTIYKFSYLYDNQNRLTESNRLMPTSEQQLSEGFAYSNNGSITNLQRYADTLLVDNLSFSYTSGYNKLIAITDAGDDANFYNLKEYHDTHLSTNEEPDFGYDSNGNLIFDKDRGISHITYNLYNQPDIIQFTNGNQIVNLYDATGQKYKTFFFSVTATIISPDLQIQHYSFDSDTINYVAGQCVNNIETTYNSSNKFLITRIFNDEGYFENHTFKGIGNPPQVLDNNCFYYYHTDHLDNICAVYNATKNQVQQRTLYYASGLPMAESTNASKQPYKYNGKEFVG